MECGLKKCEEYISYFYFTDCEFYFAADYLPNIDYFTVLPKRYTSRRTERQSPCFQNVSELSNGLFCIKQIHTNSTRPAENVRTLPDVCRNFESEQKNSQTLTDIFFT